MTASAISIRPLAARDIEPLMDLFDELKADLAAGRTPRYKPTQEGDAIARSREADTDFIPKGWVIPIDRPSWRRDWGAFTDDGACVGAASLHTGPFQAGLHRCSFGVAVARSARRAGLGRRLTEACIAWAEAEPTIDWIDLLVFSANAHAIRLYEELGWREVGRVDDRFRVDGAVIDEILMARSTGG